MALELQLLDQDNEDEVLEALMINVKAYELLGVLDPEDLEISMSALVKVLAFNVWWTHNKIEGKVNMEKIEESLENIKTMMLEYIKHPGAFKNILKPKIPEDKQQ